MESQLSPVGRFETILLATDGTEYSSGAEQAAFSMAQRCEAKLFVLRIVLTNPEYEAMAPERVESEDDAARAFLAQMEQRAKDARIDFEGLVRHGSDPYLEIVDAAAEVNADVIIIGRRSRSDLARLMMGDSTAKVIGHAPCNVFVVPRAGRLPEQRILAATDGSRLGDSAAATAISLARHCKLPLTVVSVDLPSHSEARRNEARVAIDRVRESLKDSDIAVDAIQEEGRPETVIVEVAKRQGADLIVIGSHGRTGLQRLLMGSISERVIGQSECAVLVVKAN